MDDLANRFCILQRRFVEFSERVPTLLRMWLSRQPVSSIEVSLDALADYLFVLEGMPPAADAPQPWLRIIARCALEDQLSCIPFTSYGSAGTSVVFHDVASTLFVEWPKYTRTCVMAGLGTEDTDTLRRRNCMLEVRVQELETRLAAKKMSGPRTEWAPPARALPCESACTVENTHAFLLEKRFEAEDAIAMLRRFQDEIDERKRVLEVLVKEKCARLAEQRRADARKARRELAIAMNEIARLREELESLRTSVSATVLSQQQADSADSGPIVPRRALKIAGFWGVSHNDILLITPHLIEKFEHITGSKAIRRKDLQVCFPAKDQQVLIDVVLKVMAEHLPQYARAGTPV